MPESRKPQNETDVEQLADTLLAAVEEEIDSSQQPRSTPDALTTAAFAYKRLGIGLVRRYNRLQVDAQPTTFDSPVLFVANHGFGGIFDLNVFAIYAALEELELHHPVTALSHQLAWTLRLGPLLEPLGARPASKESAREAFADGQHVLVFPGGDLDAFKSWEDRNRIVFGGRTGFARLAMEHGVPSVPIVTAGAGAPAIPVLQ
jgi:1-acyl-sn-glycerol-3-phosphate acyltransferase